MLLSPPLLVIVLLSIRLSCPLAFVAQPAGYLRSLSPAMLMPIPPLCCSCRSKFSSCQSRIGGGGGDGGAAEEMDQDGSDAGGSSRGASGAHGGAATPENWEQMSRTQRRDWHKHRRRREKARAVGLGLSRNA